MVEVKWTPSSPSSPHWYDRAAFTALVYSHIRHTHNDHPDKPIGEFIREFDGLTSTAKAKAVRAATPGVTHLSQLDGRDDVIGALLLEIREEMKIFVLHDADINGYDIARTLGEATRRMPNHNIDVIDLGLTVPQAIEYGLETEQFTRRKALPADLALDADAREWFTGRSIYGGYGKPHYECTRCELNAFSADQLAEFIEAALHRHDATTKLVPPADVLAEQVQKARDEALTDLVKTELARLVDVDAVVDQLLADHPEFVIVDEDRVRANFTDYPTRSWRSTAEQLVSQAIDAAGLVAAAREQIAEQLSESMNDDDNDAGERS